MVIPIASELMTSNVKPTPQNGAVPQSVQVALSINRERHVLELDPWVTLLDLLRERLQPHRHQERLRSRSVRRLHRVDRRQAR